ncbi:MAG: glycosyltransferase involved in cell wall biosynthesis [Candidatus Latescibacterota bacterium]|jgi:glycosyltransferase involved in cell wall biosynthesis
MNNPLVSTIMPTHNYGQFIEKAIDSVLNQTYPNIELIIVDDASTDQTLKIIEKYKDKRITLIQRAECSYSGVVSRNDGMAISKGVFIAVADADDISLPDRFERQVDFFRQHPQIDLLGGSEQAIDENGESLCQNGNNQPKISTRPQYPTRNQYRKAMMKGKNVLLHATLMFRKSILQKLSGYQDCAASGDTEFVMRASRYFNLYNLNETLVQRRIHPKSVTRTYGKQFRAYYYPIFLMREHIWTKNEIERLEKEQGKK